MMKSLVFLAILLVVGCMGSGPTGYSTLAVRPAVSTVQDGDLISMDYVGYLEDGTKVGSGSLEIIVGAGQVIKGLDQELPGMGLGERRQVTIPPELAYGPHDAAKLLTIPREQLTGNNILPVEGMTVIIGDRPGIITEVEDDTVIVDLNHKLAGKTLIFEIEITNIS